MRTLFRATTAFFLLLTTTVVSSTSFGSNGLVVHTTEFGVGKFHRFDNGVHPYGATNAWSPYILPNAASTDKALTIKNTDGSYTVFFSTLDEMMTSVAAIAKSTGENVSVLNVHGHGLPGAMWFPKDEAALNGWTCDAWRQAASGDDEENYNQYYSAVSVGDIMQIRSMSNNPNVRMGCTTGAREWRAEIAKHADFKSSIAPTAQIHFISCVVGLGSVGEQFTKEIASMVLGQEGHVQTAMAFGLGDWSMPEGMGFWDYQSDDQVEQDGAKYSAHHRDREIAQKGSVRLASFENGAWTTSSLANRDFMSLVFESSFMTSRSPVTPMVELPLTPVPKRIRVPGTTAYVYVQ